MKKLLLLTSILLFSTAAFAQWTVSYHQSNLPFIGAAKQIGNHWIPEFRLGTDNFVENLSVELVANYLIHDSDSKQFYIGVGGRANMFSGAVVPFGLNLFPFSRKDFGFHIEASPIVVFDGGVLLRGSFGIRYRFLKD